ncbi:hypothetical protein [uncultured Clostridium sp.]|uniref:hypothetical protein n=1 Tax=uncultured Clostridium sp. TaxID=59620 RepID=UPI0025CE7DED|nr:hypothetical protein [uncultured Clostridium sp.]
MKLIKRILLIIIIIIVIITSIFFLLVKLSQKAAMVNNNYYNEVKAVGILEKNIHKKAIMMLILLNTILLIRILINIKYGTPLNLSPKAILIL